MLRRSGILLVLEIERVGTHYARSRHIALQMW